MSKHIIMQGSETEHDDAQMRWRRRCLRDKYARMRKVGVPAHGVYSCMLLDGVDPHTFYLDCSRDDNYEKEKDDNHVVDTPRATPFGTLWKAISAAARNATSGLMFCRRRVRRDDDDGRESRRYCSGGEKENRPPFEDNDDDDKGREEEIRTVGTNTGSVLPRDYNRGTAKQQQRHVAQLEEILDARKKLRPPTASSKQISR